MQAEMFHGAEARPRTGSLPYVWPLIAAVCAIAANWELRAAHAADLSTLAKTPVQSPNYDPAQVDFIASWLDMVSQTQAAQPHWMTPLITITPRLEQEFRYDTYFMNQGNGSRIDNYGGGKAVEFIPTYDTEVTLGMPPLEENTTAGGKTTSGWGDWPAFLLKYRFASANEQSGNYIVTGFIQMYSPTGYDAVTNGVYVVQPTLAVGKGWGDFDVQATFSQQYPVDSIGPPGSLRNFGDPLLANVTFQYHAFTYFWPELEVNYTYWPNGLHEDLSQVLLTPGVILGRIPIAGRYNVNVGLGYQIAVTQHPLTNNNLVLTARLTF
jgi:hypothetical protein